MEDLFRLFNRPSERAEQINGHYFALKVKQPTPRILPIRSFSWPFVFRRRRGRRRRRRSLNETTPSSAAVMNFGAPLAWWSN